MSKSILGLHSLIVDKKSFTVEIFQADGIPEAGHLRYSMVVREEDVKPYAVTWDGYESNRIVLDYNCAMDEDADDEHLELEMKLLEAAMLKCRLPVKQIEKFMNCEAYQLKEGTLFPMEAQ